MSAGKLTGKKTTQSMYNKCAKNTSDESEGVLKTVQNQPIFG